MSTTYFFYKIHKPNTPFLYIGKTRDPRSRLAVHKSKCVSAEQQLYKTIRENGGWSSGWKFDILETQELTTEEAMKREQELYQNHNANLNMNIPNNAPNAFSYYQKNKDVLRVKAREKYTKTKKEWKHPKLSSQQLKSIILKKCEQHGHKPTQLTIEKHEISQEELIEAWKRGMWFIN